MKNLLVAQWNLADFCLGLDLSACFLDSKDLQNIFHSKHNANYNYKVLLDEVEDNCCHNILGHLQANICHCSNIHLSNNDNPSHFYILRLLWHRYKLQLGNVLQPTIHNHGCHCTCFQPNVGQPVTRWIAKEEYLFHTIFMDFST